MLADLELLLAQRMAQIENLRQKREELVRERGEVQLHTQGLQLQVQDLVLKLEQNRVDYATYVRGVEDRAYREIDRAREESKTLKAARQQLGYLQRRLEALHSGLSEAQQQATAQQARADSLVQLLLQWPAGAGVKPKMRRRPASASKRSS